MIRIVSLLVLATVELTAQIAPERNFAALKNWPAPLYWQPTQVEAQAATAAHSFATVGSASAQAQSASGALVFVGITPCRLVDTRSSQPFTGAFGPPRLAGNTSRTFPIQSSTTCSIPSTAQAYSFNVTVVPPGPLGFITIYPTGQPLPLAATLNSLQGFIVGNAAVVAAGPTGSVDVYASDPTDLVIDINGYYLPQGALSAVTVSQGTASAPALSFSGDPGTGIFSSGNGNLDLAAGGTNGLRLESTGQVTVASGINTNGPLTMIFDPILPESPGAGQGDAVTGNPGRKAILRGTNSCSIGAVLGGFGRPWMKNCSFMCWDTDLMYVGLKDEGSNRKDAVITWGDDTASDPSGADALRVIFTGFSGADSASALPNGREVARFIPNGNVGIGNFYNPVTVPSARLDVIGNVRVRDLSGSGDSLVTADKAGATPGLLHKLDFPGNTSQFLRADGIFASPGGVGGSGNVAGSCATANLLTKWVTPAPNSVDCSHVSELGTGTFNVGIGPGTATPSRQLEVNGNINVFATGTEHYQISGTTVVSIDGTKNLFVGENAGPNTNSLGGNPIPTDTANVFVGTRAGNGSSGGSNNFLGNNAGLNNTGNFNSFYGSGAGSTANSGNNNVFLGNASGQSNTSGSQNTFVGTQAGSNNKDGSNDVYIGTLAGSNNTGGDRNIDIGNPGKSGDFSTIRIGTVQSATFIGGIANVAVSGNNECINTSDQLGFCQPSSVRFKEQITDMGDSSSDLFRLRPVTFLYKPQYDDGSHVLQYGLIAEEVAKVYPEMVAYDKDGQALTVKYQELAPMLLNELQKQNVQIQKQADTLQFQQDRDQKLEARVAALEALLSGQRSAAAKPLTGLQ